MKVLVWALLVSPLGTVAQWESVGGGLLSGDVKTPYYSNAEQRLYIAGDQRYMVTDSVQVNGIGYWDGLAWNPVGAGVSHPFIGLVPAVQGICEYDSGLIVTGGFRSMSGVPNTRLVAKWQNGSWQSCGLDSAEQVVGSSTRLLIVDDTMHYLSATPVVYQGDTLGKWCKYDGEHWYEADASEEWHYAPTSVVKYQGQLYVGGNFTLSGGQDDLVRRTATGWELLGQGLLGDPWVNDMVVYDDLLWVAGEFYQAAGNAASCLMAWDGNQWLEPFPELSFFAQCRDLDVIDGKLYFGGAMNVNGLAGMHGLGRYDGSQVCIIGGPEIYPVRFAGSADTLYMATCRYLDCSQSGLRVNGIAKWPMNAPPTSASMWRWELVKV